MPTANDRAQQPHDAGRRRALKLGAAAGVGGLVWAEPTIRGLARRPAYADALSSPVAFSWAGSVGDVLITSISDGLPNITLSTSEVLGQTLLTATYDDGVNTCACTFDAIAAGALTMRPEAGSAESITSLAGGADATSITFDGVFGIAPGGFPYDPAGYTLSGTGFSGSCA